MFIDVSAADVVILSWDPVARVLTYVPINNGAGGQAERAEVNEESAAEISDVLAGRTLPRTAQLEIADGLALIWNLGSATVTWCTVTAAGPSDSRKFKFKNKERGPQPPELPIAALGVTDVAQADLVSNKKLEYLYVAGLTPPGCWLGCEGGIDAWLTDRQRGSDAKKQEERRKKARLRRADPTRFVNPYTFVPLPETIDRQPPGGHHWLAPGRLSGSFTVTWTFTSPFQAPDGASGTAALRLPGASVKGAVRSVHETLAGGCLRVFDADFIPSYRDHAQVRDRAWRLAVVEHGTEDGQPLSLTLCDEVVWVGFRQLRQACGSTLTTGDRVTIPETETVTRLERKELSGSATVTVGGDWVVLVTDSGTRRPRIRDRDTGATREGAFLLACGRVTKTTAEVTEAAWHAFRTAAAGARDMQPAENGGGDRRREGPDSPPPTAPVVFNRQPVGYRRVTTGRLWPGDVVWARTETAGGTVTVNELSLAALWRHPGWDDSAHPERNPAEWSAGNRVPPELRACRDPGDLCPTCRVFGSVDQQAREAQDQARQRAYAGHVRFGDACSEDPVELTAIDRAPLSAPRPGAGQFYLDLSEAGTQPAAEGRKPTREWGAGPDQDHRRPLRGRKFYWHADPTEQEVPRHVARSQSELVSTRWLAPKGTVLRQRVTFDNLSRAELGGLLAALEPQHVLTSAAENGPLLLHLGGGKPLGLGSCTAAVDDLQVWTAASRYDVAPAETPDTDGYLREFADDCPATLKDKIWPSLAAVLAKEKVSPARVWYPPGEYWTDQAADPEEFDKPFTFFTASSGMHMKKGEQRPLIPLPDPAADDQTIPIKRSGDLK